MSEVALGGWLTQGRKLDAHATTKLVHAAFDVGINFFDTADVYANGEAEKALGVAIRSLKREDLFIATKCFFPMSDSPNDQGLSRKHIVESVNHSLKRLGIETIDLMQFHRFDPETPFEEIVRAIDDLVRAGKVHYWGVSCWTGGQIKEICDTAKDWLCTKPISNQPPYNMLDRHIEQEIIPTSLSCGVSQVVFSPLAQGVLTGKYKPGEPLPEGSRGSDSSSNQWMGRLLSEANLVKVQKIGAIASEFGCTTGQFALAWCLRQPNVSSVIMGASTAEQVKENAVAGVVEIPESAWQRVEEILAS